MIALPPSKVRNEYWIHTVNSNPPHPWTERSGKWLLFVPFQKLDQTWKLIAEETVAGQLGIESKAATAKPNPIAKNSWIKVVCVYTYDLSDVEDVMRVRKRLRTIGFEKKLSYKTDQATEQRIYSTGNNRVSLFFE